MFFIFSKVFAFLLQPSNWIFFLLLVGFFAKGPKWKSYGYKGAVWVFLVFTNPLILHIGLSVWEIRPISPKDIPAEVKTGIVLGGYYRQSTDMTFDRFNLNERPNRLINGLELLNAGVVNKLILSGGNGSIIQDAIPESLLIDDLLDTWCWPDSVTIPEPNSRNTFENIIFSKAVMEENGLQGPVVLITSAFHMRRSLAICRKQGLEVIPYPTDLIQEKLHWTPNTWLFPDAKALSTWNILIKELVGLAIYKLRGYA
ncbi:MAG: YdcF family protein [Saprospiraceae bacterium]|nr:YdcF family protein [Saprospiraceae bacterium]